MKFKIGTGRLNQINGLCLSLVMGVISKNFYDEFGFIMLTVLAGFILGDLLGDLEINIFPVFIISCILYYFDKTF